MIKKKLPYIGSAQEVLVNIAVPPLPKFLLHKFHLVIHLNQTAREMICSI